MKKVSKNNGLEFEVTHRDLSASCSVDSSLSSNKLKVTTKGSEEISVASFPAKEWACERLAISNDGDTVVAKLGPPVSQYSNMLCMLSILLIASILFLGLFFN